MFSGHSTRPPLDLADDVVADIARRVERGAIEAGEERFAEVVRVANPGRRCGYFDAPRALTHDRVDHAGECGTGQRACVDLAVDGRDGGQNEPNQPVAAS